MTTPAQPYNSMMSAVGAVALTLSNTADLANVPCRALYIGTSGALEVTMADGSVCTFPNVSSGLLPIEVSRVWATGTTATGVVALY